MFILLVLFNLVVAKKNFGPIPDDENLRYDYPKLHMLLHDDEITALILSPWVAKPFPSFFGKEPCTVAVFVDRNSGEFRTEMLRSYSDQKFEKGTLSAFIYLQKRNIFTLTGDRLSFINLVNKDSDNIYIIMAKKWLTESNVNYQLRRRLLFYEIVNPIWPLNECKDEL